MIDTKWIKVAGVVAVVILILLLVFVRSRRENLEGGKCGETQDDIDGKCYEKCRDGFMAKGVSCYEVCKEGETSEGLTCTNTKTNETRTIISYERAEIKVSEEFKNLPSAECEDGFQQFGTICMEKCKGDQTQTSFFCAEKCPDSALDQGLVCAAADKATIKKTYIPKFVFSKNADVSNVMVCMDGYTRAKDSALCVQACPATHVQDGALCIEQCKSDETDLGSKCLKGQTMRDKSIMTVGITEVPIRT
jgi:hypothetical protein